MKGIILEKPGRFTVANLPPPREPKLGEALVKIHRIGICGTDLHAFQGNQTFFQYPRVLGHELSVEVVALGSDVTRVQVGDHCAVEPYLNCGDCIACHHKKPNCCLNLEVLGVHVDGGMCGKLTLPSKKLHKSKTLSLNELALVETLSIGAHAVRRAHLELDESILVIGTGPIGLSVIESARSKVNQIITMEISKHRLNFCKSLNYVDHCLAPGEDLVKQLRDILSSTLPTAVFDCTGNPKSMEASFGLVAHGGRLIFVGHHPGKVTFHDSGFHARELTLLATRNATGKDFRHVVDQMEQGLININHWISERIPTSYLIEAFPTWLDTERGVIKPLIDWEEPT